MPDDSKVLRWGATVAAIIIVVRIALEQAGVTDAVNNVFSVAWLYFIMPVLFALGIRARNAIHPFRNLLKDVLLFALYTRLMVMVTYMLAYVFHWSPSRFRYPAGTVGKNVSVWEGILFIPLRNVLIWVVMACILGTLIGSVTLLLRRRTSL
jgi:hypothetical protein